MATDPKKFVRTILISYFLACLFMVFGLSLSYHFIPVIGFTFISELLYIAAILSLHGQYKKYKIRLYLFLEVIGIILAIFVFVVAVVTLI